MWVWAFKAFKVQGLGVSRFRVFKVQVVQACGFSDSGFSRSRFPKVQGFQGSFKVQGFQGSGFRGFQVQGFQGSGLFRIVGFQVQGFQGSGFPKVQGFQGSGFSRFRVSSFSCGFGLSRFKAFKVQGSGVSRFRVFKVQGCSGLWVFRFWVFKVQVSKGSGFPKGSVFPGSVVGLGFQGSRLSRFRV